MSKIKCNEPSKQLMQEVLAEYKNTFDLCKFDASNPAIRFARAETEISIDEAIFVKVVSQVTDLSIDYIVKNYYGKFSQLNGCNGLYRPEWRMLMRVAQSFSAWTPWHELCIGGTELVNRYESVVTCIRHIPSHLRRKIAEQIVTPAYGTETEWRLYDKCKEIPESEAAWQKFEQNGGKAIDLQRFCRFIRGLRRRRTFLNNKSISEREDLSIRARLETMRWNIVNVPPNRHEIGLSNNERVFASRMYPVGKIVGIEVEFGCKLDSNLQEMDGEDYPSIPGISWKTDSSVGSFENDGMCVAHRQEVNMLINPDREDEWDKVSQTLRFLRNEGGMVNATCGLHVHLDTRDLSSSQYNTRARHLRTMFKVWAKYLVNKRRATNYFCNINGTDRYSAVNVYCRTEHNTVEIRIGHSTLNLHKIRLWCEFLRWARDAKKSEIVTFDGFMSSSCNPVVKAYLLSRMVKFADTWMEEIPNKLKSQLQASSDNICM